MVQVVKVQMGGHVPIVLRAREVRLDTLDGQLFALNGAVVESIKRPDGTTTGMPSNASMIYKADGQYVYLWDTSALTDADAGDYRVRLSAGLNVTGQNVKKEVVYRLTKQGAP